MGIYHDPDRLPFNFRIPVKALVYQTCDTSDEDGWYIIVGFWM